MAHMDPLSMDVRKDLARVDDVMTNILKDRDSWGDFVRNPNGALVKRGLHPPVSPEQNERINRIFYACLTNADLLQIAFEHYREFSPEEGKENEAYHEEGLAQGRIQNQVDYDLAGADHVLRDRDTVHQMFQLTMHDLNNRGILARRYSADEIDKYVGEATKAAVERAPLGEHPRLDEAGVTPLLAGIVGPVVGAIVAAEVGAIVTAVGPQAAQARMNPILEGALLGDDDSVRKLAILGRLLDFSADLAVYVQNFERRSR